MGLYRIELLREWGKVTEALVWACLEVEMSPNNVAAISRASSVAGPTLRLGRFVNSEGAKARRLRPTRAHGKHIRSRPTRKPKKR
jgi:hypothetical protein